MKSHPDLIEHIPEAADYPELKSFLGVVNKPDTAFVTFGCEKWTKAVDYGNGITRESGLYVDIAFNFVELAMHRENYVELHSSIEKHGRRLTSLDRFSDLTLIRIQLGRVALYDFNMDAWKATFWIYGAGSSVEMANSYRTRGLAELERCLKDLDADLAERSSTARRIFGAIDPA